MVEWWFGWLGGTKDYKLWHPRDHVFCDWENREPGKYIGASHLVHEYMGGSGPLYKLRITFLDPTTIFDPKAYSTLDGVAICARSGLLGRTAGHRLPGSLRPQHRLRMRDALPVLLWGIWRVVNPVWPSRRMRQWRCVEPAITEQRVTGLHKHATEEMGYLAEVTADSLSPGERQFD
jgi:hypothetical protein